MEDMINEIKKAAKDLMTGGKVDFLIGYEKGSIPLRNRPCFISDAGDVEKLVWNSLCSNNLSVYLSRYFEKNPLKRKDDSKPARIGIIVKGCDVRSVVGLIKEKQVPRENVVMIGVPCQGIVDAVKVEALFPNDEITGYEEDLTGSIRLTTRAGGDKTIDIEQVMAETCLDCEHAAPEGVEITIKGTSIRSTGRKYEKVREFESKSFEKRWEYFKKEMSRCIRCNACRQACPNCFCKSCFAEKGKPRWVDAGTDLSDIMFFHIGRMFHQAGRCVECDACVRACPMNIDLRMLTQKLGKDVQEAFGYTAGLSIEEELPLRDFRDEDDESFITKL